MDIIPDSLAAQFRSDIKAQILERGHQIQLRGFLVEGDPASLAYAEYTQAGCKDVGIDFEIIKVSAEELEKGVKDSNLDPKIHGIFVYYPVFRDERDARIKDKVSHQKDVEGLSAFWMDKLYSNQRYDDASKTRKAILPCTPLAILKLLEREMRPRAGQRTFEGRKISIFNRSELVGRPLAYMLKHDGATVFSFDLDGALQDAEGDSLGEKPDRKKALAMSDIVITGVPSQNFPKVHNEELKDDAICLNFSFIQNFDESVRQSSKKFITRVGSMTVAMCLRNAVRLYEHYVDREGRSHARR